MEEKMQTINEFKAANPGKDKRHYKKYCKQWRANHKAKKNADITPEFLKADGSLNSEVESVGIKENIEEAVKSVMPKPEVKVEKIDFNVEVAAVAEACDEGQGKIDKVQDIIVDRAVPEEALLLLEELHIALGNVKALTAKMATSYEVTNEGITELERQAAGVVESKKKLAAIRATRTKEKTEVD